MTYNVGFFVKNICLMLPLFFVLSCGESDSNSFVYTGHSVSCQSSAEEQGLLLKCIPLGKNQQIIDVNYKSSEEASNSSVLPVREWVQFSLQNKPPENDLIVIDIKQVSGDEILMIREEFPTDELLDVFDNYQKHKNSSTDIDSHESY